ncbi:hypothetical protein [Aestuariivirga sp.]|uniref:hypothetical protein n=1 Tax=Aestuariivirga sp. TaxID=2650926 RepID=UPI0039E3B54E
MNGTTTLRGLAMLAASAIAFALPALADDATFNKPKINGVRLDWCRKWGDQCGKPAADAFCKLHEFSAAATWVQDPNPGAPTKVFSGGQICNDDSCTGFKTITCKDNTVQIDDDGTGGAAAGDDEIAQQGGDGEPVQQPMAKVVKIGGQLMGELSTSSNFFPAGQPIAVFGRGTDNALWWQTGNGKGAWNGWQRIGGEIKYSPSCTIFQKAIHCFVIGSDNALWTTQQDKKGGWYPFKRLGGATTGSPSAVSALDANGSPALYVILRSNSGELSVIARYKDQDTDLYNWSDYRGLGVVSASAVYCVFMGGTHVDCYGRNNKGETVEFADALVKATIIKLGGQTDKRPGAIASVDGKQVRVLVKGMDGKLWHRRWKAGQSFSPWKQTNIDINSQPVCRYYDTAGANVCFDVGPDKVGRAIFIPTGALN